MRIIVAQISQSALQLIIIVLLTKKTDLEYVGLYAVYSAWINSGYQLFKIGIPKKILATADDQNTEQYLSLGLILSLLLFSFGLFVVSLLFKVENTLLFVSILIYRSAQMAQEAFNAFFLKEKLINDYWNTMFKANLAALFCFGIFIFINKSAASAFIASGLTLLCFILYSYRKVFRNEIKITLIQGVSYLELIKISLSDFVNSFKTSVPRILIAEILGYSLAGIYTAIQQSVALLEVLNQSFLKYHNRDVVFNVSSKRRLESFRTLLKIIVKTTIITLLGYIVCFLFGETILSIVFNQEYRAYINVLLLLIILRYFNMITGIFRFTLIIQEKILTGLIVSTIIFVGSLPFISYGTTLNEIIHYLIVSELISVILLSVIFWKEISNVE